MYVSILLQIILPFKLLQNIEQNSLCYTIGLYWLSILNTIVCICRFKAPNTFCLLVLGTQHNDLMLVYIAKIFNKSS